MAIDSADGHDILRHSTAHVMAQAVQDLYPDARLGIGPPIENGFYYDFDVETPFVPEDLEKIETRMRKIIKEGQRFSRRVTTDADALNELKDEPYKVELIGLKGAGKRRGRGRGCVAPRSAPASSPSTTTSAATARSRGATCAAARTCRPPSGSRRSS